MKIINLGGVGGCRITDCMNKLKLRNEAFPFDWNNTNQSFPINCIIKGHDAFFSFEDQYVISSTHLISPHNNAFTCHDFNNDWQDKKQVVKEKYIRRLNRLLDLIETDEPLCFVREVIEEKGLRDHEDVFQYAPTFKVESDSVHEWDKFMDNYFKHRKSTTKLILFTVNPKLKSYSKNIEIIFWNRKDGPETIMKETFMRIHNE